MEAIQSEVKKAYRFWLHQGGTTPQLGSQYRPRYQEKWEDPGLH